jgi:hypothetical protein|eukprot:COSAG01_NODE_14859_length_1402_cov_1.718342_2_plen_76_part_00
MVAAMKETQARREAASKQLIAHYKSEAERLLTMTINSKSCGGHAHSSVFKLRAGRVVLLAWQSVQAHRTRQVTLH